MHQKYLWVVEICGEESNHKFYANLMEVWSNRTTAREAKINLDRRYPNEKHRVTSYISTRELKEVV